MPALLNYKSRQDIVDKATATMVGLTGLESIVDGSVLDGVIQSVAQVASDMYDDMNIAFTAGYLTSTSGPYLDALAADRSLARQLTVTTEIPCESDTVVISTNNGATLYNALGIVSTIPYIILPKGNVLHSTVNPELVVYSTEAKVIYPQDKFVSLSLSASLRNNQIISAGTIDTIDWAQNPVLAGADLSLLQLVQNKPIAGVEQVESDASLVSRVSTHLQTFATGNTKAVLDTISSHPDVADTVIDLGVRGTGSVDVVIIPTSNRVSKSIVAEFNANIVNVTSLGEQVKVIEPTYVPISVTVSDPSGNADTVIRLIEDLVSDTSNSSMSHRIINDHLIQNGSSASVIRLTAGYRDMLPGASINLLNTEIFELRPRYVGESAIGVTTN